MADVLSEKARALISRPVLASLATLNPDGSPQITPLWVDRDGDDVVFNTSQSRKKTRNLERDGRVAVTVIDPDDRHTTWWRSGAPSSTSRPTVRMRSVDAMAQEVPRGSTSSRIAGKAMPASGIIVRTDHIAMQG